jgi:hypothetical protein
MSRAKGLTVSATIVAAVENNVIPRTEGDIAEERARLIGELTQRNPGMAGLLIDLEADDVLRGSGRGRAAPERSLADVSAVRSDVACSVLMMRDDQGRRTWLIEQVLLLLPICPGFAHAGPPRCPGEGRFRR